MFQKETRADVLARVARENKRKDRMINAVIISIAILPVLLICGMIYIALHFLIKLW